MTANEHWLESPMYSSCLLEIIVANKTNVTIVCSGEVEIELVLNLNKFIEKWRPVLIQALAKAKTEDECTLIGAVITCRFYLDILAEMRRCSRQEPVTKGTLNF